MWSSRAGTGERAEDGTAQPQYPHLPVLFVLVVGLILLSMMLASCASSADQAAAQQSKARLDYELSHAHHDLGIPQALLQPIETQEQKISAGSSGFNYSYKDASSNYNLLYTQLIGVEQAAPQVLQQQAA